MDWIRQGIGPAGTVSALVPGGFESYARVLHPAYRAVQVGVDQVSYSPVPWRDLAAYTGTALHPRVQFPYVVRLWDFENGPDARGPWTEAPAQGALAQELLAPLSRILCCFTGTTEDCFFAVWTGFSDLTWPGPPTGEFILPGRSYRLFQGAIGQVGRSFAAYRDQSANLWWPRDRAWFVATDIDLVSTYVGASRTCIEQILGVDALESFEVQAGDPVGYDADDLNPPPDS